MSTYVILKIRRQASSKRIESVQVVLVNQNGGSQAPISLTTGQVVDMINRGDRFQTGAHMGQGLLMGANVDYYLRSDADSTKADNLENLPTF